MSIRKTQRIAALCGVTVPFLCYLSWRISGEISSALHPNVRHGHKIEHLSVADIVFTDVQRPPMLVLHHSGGWSSKKIELVMYPDSQVVWMDDRSPSGYCTVRMPQKTQEEILLLVKNIAWGKHYDVSECTDQPSFTIRYETNQNTIYGDPNLDPFDPRIRLTTPPELSLPKPLLTLFKSPNFDSSTALTTPPALSLPRPLLTLFNLLQSFNYAPAKPWLPNEVQIELSSDGRFANSTLKPFPQKLYPLFLSESKAKLQQAGRKESPTSSNSRVHPRIEIEQKFPTLQYRSEILELINLSTTNHAVLVNGVPYQVYVSVPGEMFWPL
jgi:hypothetical protein